MAHYDKKDIEYYRHVRADIITALNNKTFKTVLELGAGGCDTLAYMKQSGIAREVTALELFEIPNSNQNNPLIDRLILADLSDIHKLGLREAYFDLIICGDILEHIYNPWEVVAYIKQLLAPDGLLICSIPNIRFYQAMLNIFFQGDFKYGKEGILDMTHIRFFCRKNVIDLFEKNGYLVNVIKPSFIYNKIEIKRKILNMITLGIFRDFLTFQYIIQLRKDSKDVFQK